MPLIIEFYPDPIELRFGIFFCHLKENDIPVAKDMFRLLYSLIKESNNENNPGKVIVSLMRETHYAIVKDFLETSMVLENDEMSSIVEEIKHLEATAK